MPSLEPTRPVYTALRISLVVDLADPAAIAAGLNPFTISQTAKTISWIARGIINCPIPAAMSGATCWGP